jgi:uncharacterized membrane protein
MSDTPTELIVSAFQTEDGADKALDEIVAAKKDKLVKIREAAVVRRDKHGKLHISERGDLSVGGGAASGAAIGAVVGLFGGPIGALLGGAAGAAIGGLAGKLIDTGIPDDRLKQIGSALQPGTSAIVAMIEHTWVTEIQSELDRAGGDTLAAAVTEDIKNQLAAGKEVAYSALAAAGGSVATRTTSGAEGMTKAGVATDGESFIAGAMEATKDGVRGIITDGEQAIAGVVDATKDATAGAVDAVKGEAEKAIDATKSLAADVKGEAEHATATATATAEKAADKVADAAKDAEKAAKDALS